ncbi:arginase family protein, partial [Kribbella sancticallisti]|uniref:arginase family protein n=1 Tax=Kribbella sancticallisti TaxID=460087 RepID=UPI0031D12CF8
DVRALAGDVPLVEPGDVLVLGDADGPRRQLAGAAEASIAIPDARVFDASAIRAAGVEMVADRMAALIERENMPFWLHLDIDVVDGSVMPAVSFPVSGGLDWGELDVLLRPIGRDHRLAGVSLAGLNVDRDPGREYTAQVAEVLTSLLA